MKLVKTALAAPVAAISVAIFAALGAQAAVLEVGPGKTYSDIATAVAAAEDGDTIVVADGTYEISEPIHVEKAICVTSRNGAEKTTILQTVRTEKEFHRCLLVDNPEATVSGLTIKGGYAKKIDYTEIDWSGFGVGVVIGENGGRLLDCIVTGHRMECSYVGGAGVTMLGADSLVRNCVITGNYTMAWVSYAAGLAAKGGVVEDCDISYNTNDGNYGRGNVFFDGPVTMRRCRIVGNQTLKTKYTGWGSWGDPAGIYLYRATGSRIENCLIADNLGVGGGGGVNVECACSFVNCTIVNNSAKYGGGVWSTSSSAKFVNCLIQGNTTTDDTSAGAPEWKGSSYSYCVCPVALPGTDAGNKKGSATFAAGGYELETGSLGIDAGTSAGDYAYLADDEDLNGEGRKWGDEVDVGCYEYRATEMKVSALASADAVLKGTPVTFTGTVVNPAGYDYEVFWSLNGEVVSTEKQFTLTLNEAGAQTMVFTVHGTEFEEKTASVSVEVFPPVVRVVNAALNPGHEPSSPYDTADNAFTNIQEAIDHCIDSMAIAVDEGRYELTTKILLEKEVTIRSLGGCERTILAQTSKDGRVLEINCGKAVVDGFTLTGGKLPIRNCGAGLYIGGLGGTVSNCLITLNFMKTDMSNWGAGAYLKNGTLARSRICCNTNNLTYHNGGYNMAGGGGVWLTGSAQLLDCEVVSNAMQCTYASETMFLQPGGGVMMQNGGTMRGCLVADNFCNTWGAGVAVLDGSPKIVGCTIAGNRTTRQGGGIRYGGAGYASSVLKNCAVWGNEAALGGADIDFNGATPQVSYCCSSVGALEDGVDGNVISAESPFRRAHGTSYYPKGASKLVDNGDTAEATETDLLRRSRVVNGTVDIGCYEFPWHGLMLMVK